MTHLRTAGVFVAAILLGFVTTRLADTELDAPPVGNTLAELRTVLPGEDTVSVSPVNDCSTVILLFDRDCPHCMRQVADWEAAISKAPNDVQFIAISLRPSVAGYRLLDNPRVHYLGFSDFRYLARVLGLTGVPATVVVDYSHQIKAILRGTRNEQSLTKQFSALDGPGGRCEVETATM